MLVREIAVELVLAARGDAAGANDRSRIRSLCFDDDVAIFARDKTSAKADRQISEISQIFRGGTVLPAGRDDYVPRPAFDDIGEPLRENRNELAGSKAE